MTLRRAASLLVVVGLTIGILTGLSHIGHGGVSSCNGDWEAVVGQASDAVDAATLNNRAGQLVAQPCSGADHDVRARVWYAVGTFRSQADAQSYVDSLVRAGYAKTYGVTPYVRPKPTTLTPNQ